MKNLSGGGKKRAMVSEYQGNRQRRGEGRAKSDETPAKQARKRRSANPLTKGRRLRGETVMFKGTGAILGGGR